MLESFPFALLIGIVFGFLSGLGVGGGSLLIMWLTLVLNMAHPEARTINLLFFIPSAIIASFFRWKQKALEVKALLPAIIGGCISAAVFTLISRKMDIQMLKKLFGILLLLIGLRELLYKTKKNAGT